MVSKKAEQIKVDKFTNKKAPIVELLNSEEKLIKLSDYLGKKVLLYFYPRDMTPGCTIEAQMFNKSLPKFDELNTIVLGVSTDSCNSHQKFSEKHKLNFELLSDEKREVVNKYGVWVKKKFMGKEYMGTNRETFLINEKGIVVKHYTKVNPLTHADEVIRDIKELNA